MINELKFILTFLTLICFGTAEAQEYCNNKYDFVWILGAADRDTITDEFGGSEINFNVVNGSRYLHVIQEPNVKGVGCRFEQHAIQLPTYNNLTLPHFPNYRLGAISDSLCEEFLVHVSTDVQKGRNLIYLYPNPASESVQVGLPDNERLNELSITIYDLNGHAILTSNEQTINVESIPQGIYYFHVATEATNQIVKLAIVR